MFRPSRPPHNSPLWLGTSQRSLGKNKRLLALSALMFGNYSTITPVSGLGLVETFQQHVCRQYEGMSMSEGLDLSLGMTKKEIGCLNFCPREWKIPEALAKKRPWPVGWPGYTASDYHLIVDNLNPLIVGNTIPVEMLFPDTEEKVSTRNHYYLTPKIDTQKTLEYLIITVYSNTFYYT